MQAEKDTVVTVGNSIIQHGKHSDRVYLMSIDPADMPDIADLVIKIASEKDYSKIFAKVPVSLREPFVERGFRVEAEVPRFFFNREACAFMAKYLDPLREMSADKEGCEEVLRIVESKSGKPAATGELGPNWSIRKLDPSDARHAVAIYKVVFATYPFPIHDESYIQKTMRENVAYYGVYHDLGLVALASAEMDPPKQYAEMTDFATLPDYRGHHLAEYLLRRMEEDVAQQTIKMSFTIARAVSVGMNLTFARCGYDFAGTLYNNTNISGGIESMNVWYKHLD